jgi:AcrR family transcriptional regulator
MTRGRPRDEARARAILDATLRGLATRGYHALSVDAIVRAAGASKPTVYRRWPTKAALCAAAIEHALATANPPPAPGGDPRAQVRAILANLIAALTRTPLGGAIRNLVGAADDEPALAAALARVEKARRPLLRDAVARLTRGDPEPRVDALLGAIYYRLLIRRSKPSPRLADQLVATIA